MLNLLTVPDLVLKMAAVLSLADSPEKVCDFLKKQIPSVSSDILEAIIFHKLDGETFLGLNDEYLREIAPRLGDRIKIKVIQAALLGNTSVSKICEFCV